MDPQNYIILFSKDLSWNESEASQLAWISSCVIYSMKFHVLKNGAECEGAPGSARWSCAHVARKGCCFGVLTVLTVFADKLLVFEWTAFKTQPHGYSDRNTGSSQRFSVSNHSTQEDKSPAIEIAPHGQQAELGARCLKWQLLELGSCVFASRKASAATRQKAEEAAERMLMQHARFKPLEDSG